jgi:HlyD family secretion protein
MKNPNAIRSGVSIAAILAIALLAVSCNRVDDDGSIRVSGNIEVDDARLAFKVPGLLVERAVSEGETVTQGQVVARLDDTEQIQQVEVQRAEVAAAAAALADLEAGSRPQEIDAAKATGESPRGVERMVAVIVPIFRRIMARVSANAGGHGEMQQPV